MAKRSQLPKNLQKKYVDVMKKERRGLAKHFRKDGWPLDFFCYVSSVSQDVLGVDLATLIWMDLHKWGYEIKLDLDDPIIARTKIKKVRKNGKKRRSK